MKPYYYGAYFYYVDAPKVRNNIIDQRGGYASGPSVIYGYYCDNDMEISGNQILGSTS